MALNTDLASESFEDISKDGQPEGVRTDTTRYDTQGVTVTEIEVYSEQAAELLGKPIGLYITLEFDEPIYEYSPHFAENYKLLSGELKKVCKGQGLTLFMGLGNRRITPDSLGVLAAENIFATRHIKRLATELFTDDMTESAVVSCGVMAQTGIESAEAATAFVRQIKPSQMIVCDALACSEPKHMGRTVQLCSTGISPGSGVGNDREELSEKTLDVPTAAIGVPTVSRLMCDDERFDGLLITPKPVDKLVENGSKLIAAAVNNYLHPELSFEEILTLI